MRGSVVYVHRFRVFLIALSVVMVATGCTLLTGSRDVVLSDDFEEGNLDGWTIGGRQEGTAQAVVVSNIPGNSTQVAYLRHEDFSEITIEAELPFQDDYRFEFDMRANADAESEADSDFYGMGGVRFLFLDGEDQRIGGVYYLYATSSHLTTQLSDDAGYATNSIEPEKWNSYSLSTNDLLTQVSVERRNIEAIVLQFIGYASGWPYNMSGEVWVDNVTVLR